MVIRGLRSINLPHTFKRSSITLALQPWSGPKHMTLDVGSLSKHSSVQLFSGLQENAKLCWQFWGWHKTTVSKEVLYTCHTFSIPQLESQIKERGTELNTAPKRNQKTVKTVYSPKLAQNLMNTCSVAAGHWLENSVTPGCRSVVPCLALTGVLYPPPSGPQIPAFGFWLPNDNSYNLADPSFHPPSAFL